MSDESGLSLFRCFRDVLGVLFGVFKCLRRPKKCLN